jgi:hypothetical protein
MRCTLSMRKKRSHNRNPGAITNIGNIIIRLINSGRKVAAIVENIPSNKLMNKR